MGGRMEQGYEPGPKSLAGREAGLRSPAGLLRPSPDQGAPEGRDAAHRGNRPKAAGSWEDPRVPLPVPRDEGKDGAFILRQVDQRHREEAYPLGRHDQIDFQESEP